METQTMHRPVRLIRSARKTVGLQITQDGEILLRAPLRLSEEKIQSFLDSKDVWIETHLARITARSSEPAEKCSEAEVRALAARALTVIPPRVATFAAQMGVSYAKITIRNQATRYGSCSSAGNLNFNCVLLLMPEEMMDYVIVHELCHRKEMNHSARFWKEVETVLPDYKRRRAWIKEHGNALIQRIK